MVRALPDDGNRYEVVYGELLVTPAPRPWREIIQGRILVAIATYLRRQPVGEVLGSRADISWGPDVLVSPDVFVVTIEQARTLDWSQMRDLLLVAEEAGIPLYWIVDADERQVEIWTPADSFPPVRAGAGDVASLGRRGGVLAVPDGALSADLSQALLAARRSSCMDSAALRFNLLALLPFLGLMATGPAAAQTGTAKATFAGGCFWCMEEAFEKVGGVVSVTSGYTGGRRPNPTYEQVSNGGTGHAEAIEVVFDPSRVSYQQLLQVFWRNIDPLAADRQFCDHGRQYRSAIFYQDEEQHQAADASKRTIEQTQRFDRPIATEIVPGGPFYPAEEYHQDYYRKNPVRYKFYKWNCGRAQRLEELWGKPKG